MDLVFLMLLPTLLWLQSWYLLGYYPNTRNLGVVAAAVAIALLGIVLFQDMLPMAIDAPRELGQFLLPETAFSVFILVWAVYAVLVAGVYLWGLESRSLGFYSLLLAMITGVFAVYFFVGDRILDDGTTVEYTWLMGVASIMLAVLAAFQFFYLALPSPDRGEPATSIIRSVTGWFYLVFSIGIVLLGAALLLGIDPTL